MTQQQIQAQSKGVCNVTGEPFEEIEFEDGEIWGATCSECGEVLFQEKKPF